MGKQDDIAATKALRERIARAQAAKLVTFQDLSLLVSPTNKSYVQQFVTRDNTPRIMKQWMREILNAALDKAEAGTAPARPRMIESFDPDGTPETVDPDPEEPFDPDPRMTVGTTTGPRGIPSDASPQFDVTGGLGAGGAALIAEGVLSGGGQTFAAEFIADYWRLPHEVHSALRSGRHPHAIAIIPVQGNSMAPVLVEGDYVFVDTRHKLPSPDGIYALLDEYDNVIVKTLRAADRPLDDEGPWVEIVSKNAADYPVKVRRARDLQVVGRVVRRFTSDFGND